MIFGLSRVIFASQVYRRIEYHWSRKASISLSSCDNITLCASKEYHFIPTEKRELSAMNSLFSLSACNMGLGLAHLRLTSQMRCSHFSQSEKFSAKDITLFLNCPFLRAIWLSEAFIPIKNRLIWWGIFKNLLTNVYLGGIMFYNKSQRRSRYDF